MDEIASCGNDGVSDSSVEMWCKEKLYAAETSPSLRRFLVGRLYYRGGSMRTDLLVQADRDGLNLPGVSPTALLAAFVCSEGENGAPLATAHVKALLGSAKTVHVDGFDTDILDCITKHGDATSVPLLIELLQRGDWEVVGHLAQAFPDVLARCGTVEDFDKIVDIAADTPKESPERKALDIILYSAATWSRSMEPARLQTSLRRCFEHLDPEGEFQKQRKNRIKATLDEAVAGLAEPEACDKLMSMFATAQDAELRAAIAGILAKSGDPRVPEFAMNARKTERDSTVQMRLDWCAAVSRKGSGMGPWAAAGVAAMGALALVCTFAVFRRTLQRAARAPGPEGSV